MSVLVFLVCIFFLHLSMLSDKRIYNPGVLFNFWWGITIFISGFGFFAIWVPSTNTYLIMLAAIIAFNIPYLVLLTRQRVKNTSFNQGIIKHYNIEIVIKFIIAIQSLVIAVLIQRSLNVLRLLASGMYYELIRYEYFYGDKIMSGHDLLIDAYLIYPIVAFSMIFVSLFVLDRHYNKLLMYTTVICVGLYAFSSGGRDIVLTFGLVIVLAFLIQGRKIKINISKRIWFVLFSSLITFNLVYITIARSRFTKNLLVEMLRTVTIYFTAPYIYFEQLTPYILQDNVLLYGGAFFGGIIDTFIYGLLYIGLDINTMQSYIGKFNQLPLAIGNNLAYNAFPTMVYTFLYDFSYVGVILGPLLFGIMARMSYRKMIKTNRLAYKGIYIMIALMIFESVMKWVGISASSWIVIAIFLILDRFMKKRIRFKSQP